MGAGKGSPGGGGIVTEQEMRHMLEDARTDISPGGTRITPKEIEAIIDKVERREKRPHRVAINKVKQAMKSLFGRWKRTRS